MLYERYIRLLGEKSLVSNLEATSPLKIRDLDQKTLIWKRRSKMNAQI